MKRSRLFTGTLLSVLVLGSLQYATLSPADFCWGEEEKISVISQIQQHLKDKAKKLSDEDIDLVAQIVFEDSQLYGVDYRLVLAIMKTESDYRHHVTSSAGARGIMQIHPSLAKGIAKEAGIYYTGAKDLFDPHKNIRLGIHYISMLIDLFGDVPKALFAYSVGHHKAIRLMAADKNHNTFYTKRVIAEYQKNTKKMIGL
ncbi:MAG: lytic transglycosylase domain-containing protein [Syntrophobacterales bacterium]|jgi:soluble lytic murein transglycosylase|nr:lytic transglycosylase domain-containing protein [Syntrophobacterales bacterium]